MRVIRGLHNLRAGHRNGVATIGNFDGVHRGHQAVIARVAAHARQRGQVSTVIAFEPTPAEYFSGQQAEARLTVFAEKAAALAKTRIAQFLCLRFDGDLAGQAPQSFVEQVLVDGLGARHVVVGDDFHYGKDRAGDFASLCEAGKQHGFTVARMPTFDLDGERVSSSAVRKALATGNLQRARVLLGRPYTMYGRVIRGQRLGRQLGYPTANIAPARRRAPLSGIFAVRVVLGRGRTLDGVASLGCRPTVSGDHELLEVHLFDFDGTLYGEKLQVQFMAKLRDEAHFENLDVLVEQMRKDEHAARCILRRYA